MRDSYGETSAHVLRRFTGRAWDGYGMGRWLGRFRRRVLTLVGPRVGSWKNTHRLGVAEACSAIREGGKVSRYQSLSPY